MMTNLDNSKISEVFLIISILLEIRGDDPFTLRAYRNVSRVIDRLPVQLSQMINDGNDLKEIPGIGNAISEKILELVRTGDLRYYQTLLEEFPDGILELIKVPGLGPKSLTRIWKELGVGDLGGLQVSIENGSLKSLPRMGEKVIDGIQRHLDLLHASVGLTPSHIAMPIAKKIVAAIQEELPGDVDVIIAGELRRLEEEVSKISIVCEFSEMYMEFLSNLQQMNHMFVINDVKDVKICAITLEGINLEICISEKSTLILDLIQETGPEEHYKDLLRIASKKKIELTERSFSDEVEVYQYLGLQYIPPELRSSSNILQMAISNSIPRLVSVNDIKGDLHVHSTWSDGKNSLYEMVEAARSLGLEYVAMTDHSAGLGIANGLSPERLIQKNIEIKKLNDSIGGIKVLSGSEVDIRSDGSLDYSDSLLGSLDFVVASIHNSMNQDSSTMTNRIVAAMKNPAVTVIGHLSTRKIGIRPPIEADFELIFQAAIDTGTALEINSSLVRMDIKDLYVNRARELGVALIINTDSHKCEDLKAIEYGVKIAMRGFCQSNNIVNTLPLDSFLKWIQTEKSQRQRVLSELFEKET
ncbi:MAG: PHP domain-containing protein [Dehalococcoidia bacterium]